MATGIIYGAMLYFFRSVDLPGVSVMRKKSKMLNRTVPRAHIAFPLNINNTLSAHRIVAVGLVGAPGLAASGSPLAEAWKVQDTQLRRAYSYWRFDGYIKRAADFYLAVSREAYAMALRKPCLIIWPVSFPCTIRLSWQFGSQEFSWLINPLGRSGTLVQWAPSAALLLFSSQYIRYKLRLQRNENWSFRFWAWFLV